jgi:putative ubiquitin-RnfH superfamily antitoxin RatB of RatAB toxin-antitoxin module
MDDAQSLKIQVCYATPDLEILLDLAVPGGTTVYQAIRQSGILKTSPEIDLSVNEVGIHGKLKTLDTVLRDHDRIEIYRPLIADPKETRRRRANKKESAR